MRFLLDKSDLGVYNRGMIKNHVIRKHGRRKAGSYARPNTKKMKRAASKAARKLKTDEIFTKLENDDYERFTKRQQDLSFRSQVSRR
mgnify:FL=1